jgi:hypothetical protein
MPDTPSASASPSPQGDTGDQRQRQSPEREERTGRGPAQSTSAIPGNHFPITRSDWFQLRSKISGLKMSVPYLASVSWTSVGVTASTLLALLGWLPVDSALPTKARMQYTFVTPLLIIAAIAGTVIAVFTFVVVHQAKQIHVATVDSVLADMAVIYEPYSHSGGSSSPADIGGG